MIDYTLCTNKNCPLRTKCYRGSVVSKSTWQSYCWFEIKDGVCEHFIKVEEKDYDKNEI